MKGKIFLMKSFDKIMISEEFMTYMNERDEKSTSYWKKFIEEHTELKDDFDKAVILYEALTIHKKRKISDEDKTKASDYLLLRIDNYEKSKIGKTLIPKRWIGVAAAIALFVCLAIPASHYVIDKFGKNLVYNEITVPSGEKSTVRLSDGTVIWLNSESKLKYPSVFKKDSREVILEGEGYFNVANKKGTSFAVVTQDIKVTALGTIFNIKSYPADNIIETTLVEGKVKLQQRSEKKTFSEIVLKPNEKAIYRKSEKIAEVESGTANKEDEKVRKSESKIKTKNTISIKQVNTSNIISWKDHLLVFDNETLEEIAVKMSRWYKTEVIIYDNELKKHRFTGKFIHNETYLQVLEAINLTTPIVYDIKENQIYIKRKYYKP